MVIITLELTRVNPDRNIFSKNVELTPNLFTLYEARFYHHQTQILNNSGWSLYQYNKDDFSL